MRHQYYKNLLASGLLVSLLVSIGLPSYAIVADETKAQVEEQTTTSNSSQEFPQSLTEPSSSEPMEGSSSSQETEDSSSDLSQSTSDSDTNTSTVSASSSDEENQADMKVGVTEESGVPQSLYRLYNSTLKVHLYTKDTNEYQVLATRGWQL